MCMYLDLDVVRIEFEAMRLRHEHWVHHEPMSRYGHHQLNKHFDIPFDEDRANLTRVDSLFACS